ncbi:DUF2950 family protein [Phyllobacterium zundukense]|uniref:DUF2950 domain-containing protein n=1 Tax=Phyllobacterium zundukense TaxID=1867719 RepID=A0A2N9W0V1_9HYPH|nr:DUF2950 family protein [Phyllobacterium zundukense]ATU90433.1 hypothetical protein BLM14_01210 [Phyllobacterium zundukense]PIO45369.1 hypothetical protein B5P45_07825 [Phyllobacterium zundukense]
MYRSILKILLASAFLSIAASSLSLAAEPSLQRFIGAKSETFKEPAEALEALKKDLGAKDVGGLAKILGLNAEAAKKSDDFDDRLADLQKASGERAELKDREDGSKEIILGNLAWPFPFPLVKNDAGWQFDTQKGLEEILARRIGENENEAMRTCRNYVLAQTAYAQDDHDGDDVLEFAQKTVSGEGKQEGLYWKSADGEESPAGSFGDDAKIEAAATSDRGYFGYRYRILRAQGSNIAGGKYDFVINGNMIAGHALIAWPAIYGETGIKTFVVSHHGTVYEKDLGPGTDKTVKQIRSFNPDQSWEPVED